MAAFFEQGKYKILVTRQALVENKKGNPEFQLAFKVTGFVEKDGSVSPLHFDYERIQFMTLTDLTIGTPQQPGWVMQTLQALGFDGHSFGQLDPEHPDAISFVGRELEAICKHEEYEGKEREKWNVLRPGAAGAQGQIGKTAEKKTIRTLDTKFGKVLKALAKTAPPKTESNTPSVEPEPVAASTTSEDIPF